jgi:hypothetical protein
MSDETPIEKLCSPEDREEALEALQEAYVANALTMEDYERMAAMISAAKTDAQIGSVMGMLPDGYADGSLGAPSKKGHEYLRCDMESRKIFGGLLTAKRLDIDANMSTVKLYYNYIEMPRGRREVNIDAKSSHLVLYITDRIQVDCRLNNRMSSIREPRRSATRPEVFIDLTGSAEMCSLKIVRKRAKYR